MLQHFQSIGIIQKIKIYVLYVADIELQKGKWQKRKVFLRHIMTEVDHL